MRRILRVGDDMTSIEMRLGHNEDSPDCPLPLFQVGPSGYRCVNCGWELLIEEDNADDDGA